MARLYNFPARAEFGRVIPKSRIYEHSRLSRKTRDMFVSQVKKITWSYKLAPETVNIPEKDGIREIQIITVDLKTENLHHDVLKAIDRAIPSPIFFILSYNGQARYAAAFKRQSEADSSKWVISDYFQTGWMPDDSRDRAELPVALDMAALYHTLLSDILPVSTGSGEDLQDAVKKSERINALSRDVIRLEQKMQREKQFNRRVEINRQVRKIRKEIEALQAKSK